MWNSWNKCQRLNERDCFFRYYILRERPTAGSRSDNIMEDIPLNESGEGALLGLPESETDLDVRLMQ